MADGDETAIEEDTIVDGGWWWPDAVEKAEKIIKDLEIPWDDLAVSEDDITDGNLVALSEKLAKTSYYIIKTNNILTRVVATQAASKEALEHAVSKILATGDDINGRSHKPAIEARRAAIISNNARLREAKIDLVESQTILRALENVKESLDISWKTISRILSARLHEPIDR